MYSTAQALREEIRKARGLTKKPFGVNINLFPALKPQNVGEYVDAALEEGIGVIETAGRSPEELVARIKKGKVKLMHKCARLRDAKKAESIGADLVEIVGLECGGHPSREGIGGLVLSPPSSRCCKDTCSCRRGDCRCARLRSSSGTRG
jgi:nitronate monooxygenase